MPEISDLEKNFHIADHAALFAFISRSASAIIGAEGRIAVIAGVRAYGRERGMRMAMRAIADGEDLDAKNYIVYGEWTDEDGECASEVDSIAPMSSRVVRCGWCETWRRLGVVEDGAVYCDHIDESIVRGFSPKIELKVGVPISRGGESCSFRWPGLAFADEEELRSLHAKRAEIVDRVARGFLFHTAHLFSTLRRSLMLRCGLIPASEALADALASYEDVFGAESRDAIVERSRDNFYEV